MYDIHTLVRTRLHAIGGQPVVDPRIEARLWKMVLKESMNVR